LALSALVYTFEVQLSNVDRHVYESLSFKAAQHPSETDEFLLARVLAYCLEFQEGIAFSRGLAEPDEPAVAVRDLTGALRCWIDVGSPDAARLHKASKMSPRLVIYTHKDPQQLLRQLAGERIHRREHLEIVALDRGLMAALAQRLERRMRSPTGMCTSPSAGPRSRGASKHYAFRREARFTAGARTRPTRYVSRTHPPLIVRRSASSMGMRPASRKKGTP